MEEVLFNFGNLQITINHLVGISIIILITIAINVIVSKKFVPNLIKYYEIEGDGLVAFQRMISILIWLMCGFSIMAFLDIDGVMFKTEDYDYKISNIVLGLIGLQFFRVVYWVVTNFFIHRYYTQRDEDKKYYKEQPFNQEHVVNRVVLRIVSILSIIWMINTFNVDYKLFNRTINGEEFRFTISGIFVSFLIFFIAQLVVWLLTQLILYGIYRNKKIDVGAQFAINQLLKYVVYVVAFVIILDNLGINITILLGGAAALLVGIGLGLQQTFNDFISGIVLLFERTVAVGDVLEVGAVIGTVKKIGLRASTIETRGNITVLVPNSKLVNEQVINWTHFDDKVRFEINIGVAYGSDTEKVKEILLEVAVNNPYVVKYPSPTVRFKNFGDNSLDFKVFFYSRNFIVIEDIKSDMRFAIDKKFRENNISIPFPQRDVWIRQQP